MKTMLVASLIKLATTSQVALSVKSALNRDMPLKALTEAEDPQAVYKAEVYSELRGEISLIMMD